LKAKDLEEENVNTEEGEEKEDIEYYLTNEEKLWNAIEQRSHLEVIKDLSSKVIDINYKNVFNEGWSALHYAVHESNLETVKFLIEESKAQVDTRTT